MNEACVIVGGGVAGLSAANRLVDSGISPLIIDSGQYPSHKVCGEFLSHESLATLQFWGLDLQNVIHHCRIIKGSSRVEFQLPIHSHSCSRFELDAWLLERARSKGARVLTGTQVNSFEVSEHAPELYELKLSNGEKVLSSSLMLGTGRIQTKMHINRALPLNYVGFKAHFEGIDLEKTIEMHSFDGGYLGLSPIDGKTTNLACLVSKAAFEQCKGVVDVFMECLLNKKGMSVLKERLSSARMIFPKWLMAEVPEFGMRNPPALERVYWIGDAAGSIPPISGEGLAIAITSGCMAGDFFINSNAKEFKSAWLNRYKKRFFWAKQLHRVLLNPTMSCLAMYSCQAFPSLLKQLWKLTRE